MEEKEPKTIPDYFREAEKKIKTLEDADILVYEIAKENEVPDWNEIWAIMRRVYDIGYIEGKKYEKHRIRSLLGLNH